MKSTQIMTFEQFKDGRRSQERIDEGLFTNYDKAITEFTEDITSGKLTKVGKLKSAIEDFHKFMKRQGAAYATKATEATKGLTNFLNNPKGEVSQQDSKVPADLEKTIAMVVLQDFKVGKDAKGKWAAGTKITPHGTGGASAAKWN